MPLRKQFYSVSIPETAIQIATSYFLKEYLLLIYLDTLYQNYTI
jgi:hypothetical protein